MITQQFDLNLIPDSAPVVVHVNQYDKGTGRLVISLYDGDMAYSIASSASVSIQGAKPDGKGFSYLATYTGNRVTANVTDQMTAVAGIVRCQIVVTEGNNVTGTFVFQLDVQKSALPADTDMSESDYQIVEDLLKQVEEAILNTPYIGANGNWWVWSHQQGKYVDSGVDASITVHIADITMLDPDATPYVTNTGTDTDPIFHLFIPRGKGISNIQKTSTNVLDDTYTITYSDGSTYTYIVSNGRGISSLAKTGTNILTDTYTIVYNDGTSQTYDVVNGRGITSFKKTSVSGLEDTYTITYSDGTTTTLKVVNGNGIKTIAKTSTSGLVDVYTITYDNGDITNFPVTNGKTAYQSAVEGGYSGTEAEFEDDLANFETWAIQAMTQSSLAQQYAGDAYNYAEDSRESADLSKSYAIGTNGTVRPEDVTDNAKSYSEQAAGAVASANSVLNDVVDAGQDALDAIQNALDNDAPEFEVDFGTGHLMYGGSRFIFNVYQPTGHLLWGLTI